MMELSPVRRLGDGLVAVRDRPLVLVSGAAVAWSLLLAYLAVTRHLALQSGFDLAVFAQIVWATAHGQPFFTSLTAETTNFLGFHFSPILAVLAPLYRLWPDARLLLIVQALVLGLPAILLFDFARDRIGDLPAALVAGAYLLSPLLQWIALRDYHVIIFAVPLLMLTGIAVVEQRYRALGVWLGLALLVKEEVALVAIGVALYVLLVQRQWRVGTALTTATVAWAVVQFGVLMPALTEAGGSYVFVRRYGSLGATPMQVLTTLFTSPGTVVQVVATKTKALFTWQLLAPLAGLPLLGLPVTLLALPTYAYLILGDYALQVSIEHHYTAPLIPFLFLGTVIGVQRVRVRSERASRYVAALALIASFVSAWWWGPLPGARAQIPEWFVVTDGARDARALLARIPPDARVAADWQYLPWLANRRWLDMAIRPPYRLLDPGRAPEDVLTRRQPADAFSAPLYPWLIHDTADDVLRVHQFERTTSAGELDVWEYGGRERDVLLTRLDTPFQRGLRLAGATVPEQQNDVIRVTPGASVPIWLAWRAEQPLEQRLAFTLHLVDESGDHVAQVDKEMGGGHFPTTLWHTWTERPTVADRFVLPIPEELSPGRYQVLAGVYEQESLAAVQRIDGSQWHALVTVEVP